MCYVATATDRRYYFLSLLPFYTELKSGRRKKKPLSKYKIPFTEPRHFPIIINLAARIVEFELFFDKNRNRIIAGLFKFLNLIA